MSLSSKLSSSCVVTLEQTDVLCLLTCCQALPTEGAAGTLPQASFLFCPPPAVTSPAAPAGRSAFLAGQSTHSSEVRSRPGVAAPPLSSSLLPPVQHEWYLLSAGAASSALTTKQFLLQNSPPITGMASDSCLNWDSLIQVLALPSWLFTPITVLSSLTNHIPFPYGSRI